MNERLDPVDEAWEASSLNSFTVAGFYEQVQRYTAPADPIGALATSGGQIALAPVDDRFQRQLARRRSTRTFGPRPLRATTVARLLAAVGVASAADGRRVVPSPGGLETVNAYAVGARVEGPVANAVVRYDHKRHEVAPLGPAPKSDALRRLFSLDCEGEPQLLIVWIVDARQARVRYGARALRLSLQEVGHAAQNVALRLSADKLVGYPLGGVLDTEMLDLLGLRGFDLWVAGGFACGQA